MCPSSPRRSASTCRSSKASAALSALRSRPLAGKLAYRDLGGLVFNLHRFGKRNDALVLAKLSTIARIDGELRGLESALGESRRVTVLREAGVTACPRCAAIHSSEDRFCPSCGLPLTGRADLPIATAAGQTRPGAGPGAGPDPAAAAPDEPPATAVHSSARAPAAGTRPLSSEEEPTEIVPPAAADK